MKALTLFDPWATLCVLGEKQFETRSWPTNHRGSLAIHVSKNSPPEAKALCSTEPYRSVLAAHLGEFAWHPGCIIGTVEVVGMHPTIGHAGLVYINPTAKERAFGDYSPGRWAWELKNPRRLPTPIPCRGRQGLWTVPSELVTQMMFQGFEVASG